MSEQKRVTILDCAVARGAEPDQDGNFTMGDIETVGLPFFGGCHVCHASVACYNAHPSKTNFLRCRTCIGVLGFATTDEFVEWCKQFDRQLPSGDDDEDSYFVLDDELDSEDIERAIDAGY
jgi:hypothetical protein